MSAQSNTLDSLEQAAADRRAADARFRLALLAASDELERAGARTPYATIARAAGVSRRQAREAVDHASAARCAVVPAYDLLAELDAACPPDRTTHGRRLLGPLAPRRGYGGSRGKRGAVGSAQSLGARARSC